MISTLTKRERLKKGDFRGTRWIKCSETAHFILLAVNNRCDIKRFAVTIRKKTGVAVVRNRVKRILREFFRLHKDLFKDNANNLIRVKRLPVKLTMREMEPELTVLVSRINPCTSIR